MGDERTQDFTSYRRELRGPPPDFAKARAERRANLAQDVGQGLICDTPAARTTDPETSHEAADFVRETGTKAAHQQLIVDAVRRMPGLTVIEIGVQVGLSHVKVGKRMKELETAQRVFRGDKRRVDGLSYLTWWPK